jgi:hypothetical protein
MDGESQASKIMYTLDKRLSFWLIKDAVHIWGITVGDLNDWARYVLSSCPGSPEEAKKYLMNALEEFVKYTDQ